MISWFTKASQCNFTDVKPFLMLLACLDGETFTIER